MGYFSNGTEGMAYMEHYCANCVHDNPEGSFCPVWSLHLEHNYAECNKPESFLHVLIPRSKDKLGNEGCRMFVAKAVPAGNSVTHCVRCGMPYHGAGACSSSASGADDAV